jgi:hypothetical protein
MLDQLQNVFASFQKNDVKYFVQTGSGREIDLEDVKALMAAEPEMDNED